MADAPTRGNGAAQPSAAAPSFAPGQVLTAAELNNFVTQSIVINANAAALPAPSDPGLQLGGADNAITRITIDSFGPGSLAGGILTFRRADGTAAAPTALQTDDVIGNIAVRGYGATGYSNAGRGNFIFRAAENWTDIAQGTYAAVSTTVPGGTTANVQLTIGQGVQIGAPTGGTLGVGTLNAQGIYVNGVAVGTGGMAGVSSFNTRTGAVTLTSGDVTSALTFTPAPLTSPALTGTPTAPTATPANTNTTQLATTAFVQSAITAGGALPAAGPAGSVLGSNGTVAAYTRNVGPLNTLIINQNVTAEGAPPAGLLLDLVGADGTASSYVYFQAFGGSASYSFQMAGGTKASPTAIAPNQGLGSFTWDGYQGSAYTTASPAVFDANTPAAWTPTSTPTQFNWRTTAVNATARVLRAQLALGLTLNTSTGAAPTGGDQGAGTINVAGGYYVNGAAVAPLASPTFTGTPAAPTATAGNNTTQIATTAFVAANLATRPLSTAAPASGYVMGWNGATWGPVAPAAGGAPGTPVNGAQWNNAGAFAGSSGLTLNATQVTGMVMGLGTDTTGDLYYRNAAGNMARLGIGGSGQVLQVSGGLLPSWQTVATGGGTVQSGTGPQIAQYAAGTSTVVAGATVSGDGSLAQGGALILTSVATAGTFQGITFNAKGLVTGGVNQNYAPLASPTFTGTPTLPTGTIAVTQTAGNNTTAVATTAFVTTAVPVVNTVTTPVMDGTATIGTLATYARPDHVHPSDTSRAPLASPTFTGTPAVTGTPPAASTNTTQIATTAFVQSAISAGGVLPAAGPAGSVLGSNGTVAAYTLSPGPSTAVTIGPAGTAIAVPPGRLYITGADREAATLNIDTYAATGATVIPTVWLTAGRGTVAAPTAVQLNDVIGTMAAGGAPGYNQSGAIRFAAAETFTGTAHGTQIDFRTMTLLTTTMVTRATLQAGLQLLTSAGAAPTGGDQGAGTINTAGEHYVNGTSARQRGATVSWLAGANPNGGILLVADRALTITLITGIPEVLAGAAAACTLYKAASGVALASGTAVTAIGAFNANTGAGTYQNIGISVANLAAGDRLGIVSTGTWTASVGSISVTVV